MADHPNPLLHLVHQLRRHAPLGPADREAILSLPCVVRTIDPQAYIVREGDRPKGTAVLLNGFAFRQKLTGDGGRQIVAVHIPGEPLDLQNLYLDEADHGVQALGRAEVAIIARADMHALVARYPALARALFVYTLIEASISREWILNVGRRAAPARIADVLCELAVRLQEAGLVDKYGYELPMTQEQLADVVGLTPVHVNRTLRSLEMQGLIERQRRRFSIPDWDALREVGDFNQRYLHGEVQQSASMLTMELT